MRRVLFQWRGITVYSYPAMLYLGLVAGVVGGIYAGSRHGLDPQRVFVPMLLLVAAALAGGRLAFIALHWNEYRHDLRRLLRRSDGGGAQYGGLALAIIVSLPLLPAFGIPVGAFWDTAIITILIGKVFTRFGCLLNGCCAGRPAEGPLTLNLPNAEGVWRRRVPTQLLEAALAASLLLASLYAWGRLPMDGAVFLGNLAAYGIARFRLEGLREQSAQRNDSRFNIAFSAGLVGFAAASFIAAWLLGPVVPWLGSPHSTDLGYVAANSALGGWKAEYLLLTPLAVFAVVSLFHTVGCSSFSGPDAGDIDEAGYIAGDYAKNVLGETNSATNNPAASVTVSYWRLQDPEQPLPAVTTAKDEKGAHNGVYKTVTLPPLPDPDLNKDRSPTTAQPGKRVHLAPGILGEEPAATNHSIDVQGGFVEAPPANGLNLPQFTIEAFVRPNWVPSDKGKYYCLIEHSSPAGAKKFGIAIYAGPESPSNLNSDYRWQVWMGVKTGATTKFTQIGIGSAPAPLVNFDGTNYVAVTYNGSNVKLFTTFEGKFTVQNRPLNLDELQAFDIPLVFAPNPSAEPFTIGMGKDLIAPFAAGAPPRYPFNGRIQEVAVYNVALSVNRIKAHFGAAFKDY